VFGFYGYDGSVFADVVQYGTSLTWSTNDYDWLGSGIYFWEQNLSRAWKWAEDLARRDKIDTPAVIGAVIDLGNCLNLTDGKYIEFLEGEYDPLHIEYRPRHRDPYLPGRRFYRKLRNRTAPVLKESQGEAPQCH
jgi:hypothetical protein